MNDKIKYYFDVLNRVHSHINVTTTKSAIILSFNAFFVCGIIIKFNEILNNFSNLKCPVNLFVVIDLVALSILGLAVVLIAFSTVFPILKIFKKNNQQNDYYQSNIYFKHISSNNSREEYYQKMSMVNQDVFEVDLLSQIYINSKIATMKHKRVQFALLVIYCGHIPLIAVLIIFKIIDYFS